MCDRIPLYFFSLSTAHTGKALKMYKKCLWERAGAIFQCYNSLCHSGRGRSEALPHAVQQRQVDGRKPLSERLGSASGPS